MKVAVLASGGGTNLQALLDVCRGDAPADIVLVASNTPRAGALDRARAAGIATAIIEDPSDDRSLNALFAQHEVDFVVLAGYLKLVPTGTVTAFRGRIINIHPALLPSFGGAGMYGRRVHEAVLAAGASVSGASVHLVDEVYDRGPIVAQWPVPVRRGDTPDTLAARVLEAEHRLLPAVVLAAARAGGHAVRLVPAAHHFAGAPTVPPIEEALGPG